MLRNWLTRLQSIVRTRSRRHSSWKRPARRRVGRYISPPACEVLEDRTLLSVTPTFVNDNWHLVTDVDNSSSVTAGDVVDDRNDNSGSPTAQFTLDDGTGNIGNAFGIVTTGDFTGAVASGDTITEAIGATTVGGTVNVLAGSFTENVMVNTDVNLVGAGVGNTIWTPGTSGAAVRFGSGTSNPTLDITIQGFEFQGSTASGAGEAIEVASSGTALNPNSITNNSFTGFPNGDAAIEFVSLDTENWDVHDNDFVNNRVPIFRNAEARRLLGDCFRECLAKWPFTMNAIVLLPDHLHAIWSLPPGDDEYSKRWNFIKTVFTKRWLAAGGRETEISEARRREHRRGVWQPRFWEHTLDDDDDFDRHFDYLHYNPLKHGYVRCAHEWPASSFHRWVRAGVYPKNRPCWDDGRELALDDIVATVGE